MVSIYTSNHFNFQQAIPVTFHTPVRHSALTKAEPLSRFTNPSSIRNPASRPLPSGILLVIVIDVWLILFTFRSSARSKSLRFRQGYCYVWLEPRLSLHQPWNQSAKTFN